MNLDKTTLLTLLGLMSVTACGRVQGSAHQDEAAPPPPVASQAPVSSDTYVLEFPGAQSNEFPLFRRDLSRISFDFARRSKDASPEERESYTRFGARLAGSNDPQVRIIGITGYAKGGASELCGSTPEPDLERAANFKFVPHDVADVSHLRVDFSLADVVEPFKADAGVCFGTHAAGGAWTWTVGLTPPVFDTPWVYGGPDGTGHVDVPMNAKNVDALAVVYNDHVYGLFLKRMTYTATRSR